MLWVKAFHVIFMVTWFAALFYLPRLFVYHASSNDKLSNERFKIMESKLFYGIMTPSAIVTSILGLWLIYDYAWGWLVGFSMIWLHIKLFFVVLLYIYHWYCWKLLKLFRDDINPHSHVYYRWFNEIPVFMLVGIIILVIVKPI